MNEINNTSAFSSIEVKEKFKEYFIKIIDL